MIELKEYARVEWKAGEAREGKTRRLKEYPVTNTYNRIDEERTG